MTTAGLKPFFSYLGSKASLASHYPEPRYEIVFEPFAGSAGYSLLHYRKDVVLCDTDPIICGIWTFLIRSSAEDIMRLPANVSTLDEVTFAGHCEEAKNLIGYWFNRAAARPKPRKTGWALKDHLAGIDNGMYWGERVRKRIASQVRYVKHWKVFHQSYQTILFEKVGKVTWFIDPPYQEMGHQYRFNKIDYDLLGSWCRSLRGQVIVCEHHGANWLPFARFRDVQTAKQTDSKKVRSKGRKVSEELIWTNDQETT